MNCGYKGKTILYYYGELPGRSTEMEAHLAGCPACAADLAVLKSLSAGFSDFKPASPVLRAADLVAAARGGTSVRHVMTWFRTLALSGAATAVFMLAFQALSPRGVTAAWSELDSRLDSVEYNISSLQDDMAYSSAADFDYGYADIENQKGEEI